MAAREWHAAQELLRVALSVPVGAVNVRHFDTSRSGLLAEEQSALDLRRRLQELAFLRDDRMAFRAAQDEFLEPVDDSPDGLRDLEERVDNLKDMVARANVKAFVGRRVSDRLRISPVIGAAFFGADSDGPEQRLLREMVQERDALSVEFMKEWTAFQEITERLARVEQEAQTLKLDNRQLLRQLDESAAAVASQSSTAQAVRAKEDYEKARVRNIIIRNVLQNLILGSGIDWAEDEQVMDLMLRLEDLQDRSEE